LICEFFGFEITEIQNVSRIVYTGKRKWDHNKTLYYHDVIFFGIIELCEITYIAAIQYCSCINMCDST